MPKYVLFSPVGTTDPIRGLRDGGMLHICRVYQPEKAYLYMTGEICDFDEDNRYEITIQKLARKLGTTIEVHKIKRTENRDPHIFDAFYDEFSSILRGITADNPESELILNLSSGTPQMKSALQILCAIADRLYLPIQVPSPDKKANLATPVGKIYDIETEWELNQDNNENDFENRCIVVAQKNYLALMQKETIKKHIRAYDYSAALTAAKEIEHLIPEANKLLEAANLRRSLRLRELSLGQINFDIFPVKSGDLKYLFEYLLALQLKLNKRELGDFIRGVTPAIDDLFEMCLEKVCRVAIRTKCNIFSDLVKISKNKMVKVERKRLDRNKLEAEEKECLDEEFKSEYKTTDLSSKNMRPLIALHCKNERIVELTGKTRPIEVIRNIAAHEIVGISDEMIKAKTSLSSKQIFNMMKELFGLVCGQNLPGIAWDSYDELNEEIIKKLD